MSKSITQDMAYRQSLMKYAEEHGVGRASRKYNKSRSYICFWKQRRDGTAASLAGHSPQRIHEWIREDVLVGIKLGTIQYCAKAEFVNFMASPQRLARPRTEKYKEFTREFKYIQRRERENEQRRQKRKMMKEST